MFSEVDKMAASTEAPARTRRTSRVVMAIAGAAVLVILAVGGWILAAQPSSTTAGGYFGSYNDAKAAFDSLRCPTASEPAAAAGVSEHDYLVACGPDNLKYLVGPAALTGTDVSSASADQLGDDGTSEVHVLATLSFDDAGTSAFAALTTQLYRQSAAGGDGSAVAVVLDSTVLAAPIVQAPVTDGKFTVTMFISPADASTQVSQITHRSAALTFRPVLSVG